MKNTFKRFCIERSYYYDTHMEDGKLRENALTEEEWKNQLVLQWTDFDMLGADEVLLVFHDKDVYRETGQAKHLHAHAVIHFRNQRSEESVMKLMGATSTKNCYHTKNLSGSVRYLIHITDEAIAEGKKIYPIESIIGYGLDEDGNKVQLTEEGIQERMVRKTSKKKDEKDIVKNELVCDVMEGRKALPDVRQAYREDVSEVGLTLLEFQKDKGIYASAEKDYLEECGRFYQTHEHPMTTIYITGGGGLGKNTLAMALANALADSRGVHMVGVEGKKTTFDFAGGYTGQKVSYVDEAKPTSMPLEQLLSVFDPLHVKSVNSRHYEKVYFPETVILTASMSLEDFIYQAWKPYAKENSKLSGKIRQRLIETGASELDWHREYIFSQSDCADKLVQARRRFAILVNIKSEGVLEIRVFDKTANPPYSLLFASGDPLFAPLEPFKVVHTLLYNIKDDRRVFDVQLKKAVELVVKSISYYYESNSFIRPEDCEKPFSDDTEKKKSKKAKKDKTVDDGEIFDISDYEEIC